MGTEPGVFISYATDTKPLAEELTRALQKQGIQTWADFKDLQPGQRWQEAVEHALDKAHWFLILVSPHSRATPWLEAEWRAALAKVWSDSDKMLIPILVNGKEPPPFLRNWVSLLVDPAAEPLKWTAHVLHALRASRNQVVHGLTDDDRQERQHRFSEITRAAEELAGLEPDHRERPN